MTVSDILCTGAVEHFSEITGPVPPYTQRMQLSVTVTSRTRDFLLPKAIKVAVSPTQPPAQRAPGALFLDI
jgi:hypothetical protein